MRIALLTDGIYPYVMGGMQKHSFYTAKYLALNEIHVDLYHSGGTSDPSDLDCFSAEEKKYIRSIYIPFPQLDSFPGHYIRESYAYSVEIYNEFQQYGSDVDFIYAQGFCGWELVKRKSGGMKLPPIGVHFHGLEVFQKPANFRSRLEQILLKKPVLFNLINCDHAFSLGGKLTGLLTDANIKREKIIEIPLGISKDWLIPAIKKEQRKKRIFVFIGRYERRKGVEELSEVLNKALNELDLEFKFIGPIPEDVQLESKKIQYLGSISEPEMIKTILQDADVLVCPSHSEGMPNVIVEAMASGMTVLATDVGAVSILVNDETGILIKEAHPLLIEAAIRKFIEMPDDELLAKKTAARKRIEEHFIWDKIMEKTIQTISSLLSGKGGNA